MRRLILLISVGWVPPSLGPSGACLTLGSSMPEGSLNAVEGYTNTGAAPLPMHVGKPAELWVNGPSVFWPYGVTGTSLAMAHIKPTSSRAIATVTTLACVPFATSRRERLHSLTWAFQLISWRTLGCFSSRSCRCRLTLAG
jgi:hypothetical protein